MKNNIEIWREKGKTIQWAFVLAWKLNKKVLLIWMTLSITTSVLPAISLIFQNQIIDTFSRFLAEDGSMMFVQMIPQLLGLGITMVLIGVSARINGDLIYMMMYDSYYLGMQETLMENLQHIEMGDLLKREINDEYNYIVGRAGSLTDIMSGVCSLVGKIVSIVSLLAVAFGASKIVFAVSLIYVILILYVNFVFVEKVRWDTSDFRKISRVADYYENMPIDPGTAKEIRVFECEKFILHKWKEAYADVKTYHRKRIAGIELRNLISGMGFYLFLILMISMNLIHLANGQMQVSVFLMLFTLCINIYTSISGLAGDIMSFDYGLFALDRQRKFIQTAPIKNTSECSEKSSQTPHPNVPAFRIQNIFFSYQDHIPVLQNISLDIHQGEVIALVGRNGSGKTTLTKLLLRTYHPDSGSIELYGIPYSQYSSKEIRKKIGVFFQDFFLFHASIEENISYGDIDYSHTEAQILEAIRQGGANRVIKKLKDGIKTIVGRQIYREGAEFSGGEKQQLGVARAHMSNKEIMILDEPASALDPIAEAEQFWQIKEKLNGRTAILVSHRIGFCRLADRILMLENGRLIESGTHEELIQQNGAYATFYEEQAVWYENTEKGENTE